MGFKSGKARSGSGDAVDRVRENKGLAAAGVLSTGQCNNTLSADHSAGSELCTEVIVRLATGSGQTKKSSDNSKIDSAIKAVDALREGLGFNVAQADHSGGNTCADVIAKATT